jgi:hypothetical protein
MVTVLLKFINQIGLNFSLKTYILYKLCNIHQKSKTIPPTKLFFQNIEILLKVRHSQLVS